MLLDHICPPSCFLKNGSTTAINGPTYVISASYKSALAYYCYHYPLLLLFLYHFIFLFLRLFVALVVNYTNGNNRIIIMIILIIINNPNHHNCNI